MSGGESVLACGVGLRLVFAGFSWCLLSSHGVCCLLTFSHCSPLCVCVCVFASLCVHIEERDGGGERERERERKQ